MVSCLYESGELHGIFPLVLRREYRLLDGDSQYVRVCTDARNTGHTGEPVYFG